MWGTQSRAKGSYGDRLQQAAPGAAEMHSVHWRQHFRKAPVLHFFPDLQKCKVCPSGPSHETREPETVRLWEEGGVRLKEAGPSRALQRKGRSKGLNVHPQLMGVRWSVITRAEWRLKRHIRGLQMTTWRRHRKQWIKFRASVLKIKSLPC